MSHHASLVVVSLVCAIGAGACSGSDDDVATGSTEPVATTEPARTTEAVATTEAVPTTEPVPTTEGVAATEVTTEPATSEPAPVDVADVGATDPAITEPAIAACKAFGDLDTEDGLDALMAMMTADVVVIDRLTGEQYVGADEVATYFGSLVPTFGIERADCGDVVQAANWVAGTYTLYDADGPISQGIAAMHVTDGKIDQQVNHYTPVSGVRQDRVDLGTGVLSIASQLCGAWGGNGDRDVDKILSLMSAEPAVHTERDFLGTKAVTSFATNLPYDVHTCGLEIQNYDWEAIESIMTDPETERERSMLSVLVLDPGELVREHWFYFDAR